MALSLFAGVIQGCIAIKTDVRNNTVEGYHCAPIVKVSTMEEAKKQVEMYQSALRG